ncbi:MAG: mechanosensitive ion channel family protein [Micrococcales bacterium]|nr:mechanosensitive ion channel family protein [Micrococcales bacterium]
MTPSPSPSDPAAVVSNGWDALLQNPWFLNGVGVAGIILGAVVVRIVLEFVIRRAVRTVVSGVKRRQNVDDTGALITSPLAAVRTVQRTRTLGSVLTNVVTVATIIVALILIVGVLAPQAAGSFAILTAAFGAALGIGSQGVVKDALNGISMVIEDQVGVGDVVDTGFGTGVVEAVGIRTIQIRDVNGVLWYVHNGEIQRVGNMSQGWARVIIDLAVPYEADADAVQRTILSTAQDLAEEPRWSRMIVETPEVWGIQSISADAVVVRLVVKTRDGARDDTARELRARLKRAMDEMGVRLPSLEQVVLSGFDEAGSVGGARTPSSGPTPIMRPPRAPRSRKPKPDPASGSD